MGPDRLGNGPGYRHRAPLGPKHPGFCVDSVYVAGSSNLGFDRGTAPNQNGSVKKARSPSQTKKAKNRRSSLSKITFQRALARTSTEEAGPCGQADWMFLIFLLLFGSSQKEGERLHYKAVQSKNTALPQQQTTSLRALARTSTGEKRPCGQADWMFLIFLFLFGSSQKEGERLYQKAVGSKKRWLIRNTGNHAEFAHRFQKDPPDPEISVEQPTV